jgi:hypothetical protein
MPHRLGPIGSGPKLVLKILEKHRSPRTVDDVLTGHPIDARSAVVLQHQPPRDRQHVGPMNPVIQRVEPEARRLLGLLSQPPPQLRDFREERDAMADLLFRRPLGPRASVFRSGNLFQAVLFASCGNMLAAGALRSTGVTPLPRYYGPLRLPCRPGDGYVFPSPVAPGTPVPTAAHTGLSGSSMNLSTSAAPSHPGGADRCLCSWLRGRCGLHRIRTAGPPRKVSRGRTGFTCVAAGVFAFQGSERQVTPPPARSATWRTSTYHGRYLSTNKIHQASPDAPDGTQMKHG